MCLFDKCEICKAETASWLDNPCEIINVLDYDKIQVCLNCKLQNFKQNKEDLSSKKIWIYCNGDFFTDPTLFEAFCHSEDQKEIVEVPIQIVKRGVIQYNPSPKYERILQYKKISFTFLFSEEEKAEFEPGKPHFNTYFDVFTVEKFYNLMGFPKGDYICISDWKEKELEKVNLKIEKLMQKKKKIK